MIYGVPNVWVDMKFGKYVNWRDSGFVTSFRANRFENPYEEKEKYLEKIKELPESSILYLSVGAESPKVVEELRKKLWMCNGWSLSAKFIVSRRACVAGFFD